MKTIYLSVIIVLSTAASAGIMADSLRAFFAAFFLMTGFLATVSLINRSIQ